jgi:sugar phosphate isomerase/epimerase
MQTSLAIQLYSLRREFGANAEATLRLVPALGYDAIELAGTYNWPAEQWQKLLAETGLRPMAAHVGLAALETDWAATTRFYKAIGCPTLIVPGLPKDLHHDAGFRYVATRLNALGQRAQGEGFAFGYHNHAFEFETGGMTILLAETDPAFVGFEVDTYWVERGGQNARQFIEKNAARIRWIHAKELRKADNADVPAGQGNIDFKTIIPLARKSGWPVIVEFEGEGAVEAVKQSAAYLKTL